MAFPLPLGFILPQGEVAGLTSTAYRVVTPAGDETFVPFYGARGVHQTSPVTPLVTFG